MKQPHILLKISYPIAVGPIFALTSTWSFSENDTSKICSYTKRVSVLIKSRGTNKIKKPPNLVRSVCTSDSNLKPFQWYKGQSKGDKRSSALQTPYLNVAHN